MATDITLDDGASWQGQSVQGIYDVAVVGAGIMGSATAYELAKRGRNVVLIEQFDFLHRRGSSHGESRIIRMAYPEEYYTNMMTSAFSLWQEAHEDAGFSVLHLTGGLDFGPSENHDLKAVIESCKRHNVEHKILSPEEVFEKFHVNFPEGYVGVYTKQAGVLNATKAVSMFQQLARKYGADLRDRAEVLSISAVEEIDLISSDDFTKENGMANIGTVMWVANDKVLCLLSCGETGLVWSAWPSLYKMSQCQCGGQNVCY